MNRPSVRLARRSAALALAAILAATPSPAQVGPSAVPNAPGGGYDVPPPRSDDPTGAVPGRLREAAEALEVVAGDAADAGVARAAAKAGSLARRAHASFVAMDSKLGRTVASIRASLASVAKARAASTDGAVNTALDAAGSSLVAIARDMASGMLDVATAGGVDAGKLAGAQALLAAGDVAASAGDLAGAAGLYGKGLKIKAALAFSVQAFRTNIQQALLGQEVGYAVALVRNGKLVDAGTWATGQWRTAADSPATPASTTAEINVASVTKPITAASFLYLTQSFQGGTIHVDDPIGPWLPWNWTRGLGVDDITFRELLKHRSGLANNLSGGFTGFDDLEDFVGTDILLLYSSDLKHPFEYQNGNFALFRIMIPYMSGFASSIGQHCNIPDTCAEPTSVSTAESFRFFEQCEVLNRIGLAQDFVPFGPDPYGCAGPDFVQDPSDAAPARLYWSPTPLVNGRDPGDWTTIGGGGGWYMSVVELAQFLAHLRFDKDFLTKENRELMFSDYLGFHDPDPLGGNYGFGAGKFGSYRMHGGDLCFPQLAVPDDTSVCDSSVQPAGVATCVADFPDGTQAVIAINSRGGTHPYQCSMLKNAYENAWLKK